MLQGYFLTKNPIKLNSVSLANNLNYDYIELYYLKDNYKNIFLCKTSDSNILLTKFSGYEVNNLCMDVYSNNQIETIKLQSLELYSNKSLIFKKYETIVGNYSK